MDLSKRTSDAQDTVSPRTKAEATRRVALEHLEKGAFREALESFDSALSLVAGVDDQELIDWVRACRSAASVELSPPEDELVELKRILLRSSDPQTCFRAAYNSARAYELARDYGKALFYNRIARQNALATGDELLRIGAEAQSGNIHVANSSFAEAETAYRRALEASKPPSPVQPAFRALLRDNIGYCLMSLGEVEKGLELVLEAFEFLEADDHIGHTLYPLLDLCFGYLQLDRYSEARFFGEAGLERAGLMRVPSYEKNLLYLVGEACHLGGDDEAAASYFDRLASFYPEFRNLRAYLEVFDFRNVINLRG